MVVGGLGSNLWLLFGRRILIMAELARKRRWNPYPDINFLNGGDLKPDLSIDAAAC